ncbi:hypothetical protein [Streptomyces sp. NPDC008092]|uniref:hypothetical protein n=1 Tax=Streptomyces sp. NPDC008092 TaxID=3364808 RepID=UPI0036E248D8
MLGRSEEGARVGQVTVCLEDLRTVVEEVSGDRLIVGVQTVQRRRDSEAGRALRIAGEIGDAERLATSANGRFEDLRPMFAQHVRAGLINPLRSTTSRCRNSGITRAAARSSDRSMSAGPVQSRRMTGERTCGCR